MAKELLISVIVTVYNEEKYIRDCIDSILKQTYSYLELILIDDGSTDGSAKICDEYMEKDNRVRVLHKENQGLVAARKSGIMMSSGEVITYVDGDDWIEDDFYEKLIQCYQKHHADVVLAGCIKESPTRQVFIANNIKEGYYDKSILESSLYPKILYYDGFFKFGVQQYLWNKLYKKELILKWQLAVDDQINNGEDVACLYPLLLDADSVEITNIYGYHYRIHEEAMTAKLNEDYPMEVFKLYSYLCETFSKSKYESIMKRQVLMYYTYMIAMSAKYVLGIKMTPEFQYHYYFPFEKIFMGSRIVLVAQGLMGKEYYMQLQRTSICELLGCIWISQSDEEINLIWKSVLELMPDYVVIGGENFWKKEKIMEHFCQISNESGCLFIYPEVEK